MNISVSQVREAERAAKAQRFRGLILLQVDDKRATEAEMELFRDIKASPDADALDKFLADKKVNDLFCRRILFFGDVH